MLRLPPLSRAVISSALLYAVCATPALAQLNTQHIKGAVGLKAGSQPPPHTYVILPLLYLYTTDQVIDRNGDKIPIDPRIKITAYGADVSVVTTKQLFGGHCGYQVLLPGKFRAGTMATFDVQSKKEDSDTIVGNAMNLEGGAGADFNQGKISAGP